MGEEGRPRGLKGGGRQGTLPAEGRDAPQCGRWSRRYEGGFVGRKPGIPAVGQILCTNPLWEAPPAASAPRGHSPPPHFLESPTPWSFRVGGFCAPLPCRGHGGGRGLCVQASNGRASGVRAPGQELAEPSGPPRRPFPARSQLLGPNLTILRVCSSACPTPGRFRSPSPAPHPCPPPPTPVLSSRRLSRAQVGSVGDCPGWSVVLAGCAGPPAPPTSDSASPRLAGSYSHTASTLAPLAWRWPVVWDTVCPPEK